MREEVFRDARITVTITHPDLDGPHELVPCFGRALKPRTEVLYGSELTKYGIRVDPQWRDQPFALIPRQYRAAHGTPIRLTDAQVREWRREGATR